MSETGERSAEPSVWNLPNALTMVRIVLVPLFAWLLWQDTPGMRVAACAVFVLAALTDRWDGQIARKRGLITNFGKIADSIADKALVLTALVLLSILGELAWWITIVLIVRELGITLLRFLIIRRYVMPASRGGKLKAVLQMVAISILVVDWPGLLGASVGDWGRLLGLIVMYAAVVVAVVTAGDYIAKAWRIVRSGERRS
ncbi:MAG: CDP-diacylglycerol--glycerol-3-phosphate 3-phosphatidyltransferase [Beutenbergiaceae bacterium]